MGSVDNRLLQSLYPPQAPTRIFSLLMEAPDPTGADFSRRLRAFAVARTIVFTAVAFLAVAVLGRSTTEGWGGYSTRAILLILVFAYASSLLQWWVSRSQFKMHVVAPILLVLDQALFGGVALLTGGISSGATSLFGVTCLVGALLLGIPGALTAAVAGGISFSLIVLATQGEAGYRPPDQMAIPYALSSDQAAYYYVFNLLMLVLIGLLASYLAERLQRAGGELKVAHQRVERAERLAALGRLAAGLAHEIRNPLGAISGSVQMLRESSLQPEDRELCDIVLRESERLNDLVSDMLDLSRPREPQRASMDLGRLVQDVVELAKLSGRGGNDVRVYFSGTKNVFIWADADQIRQLVWNLVRNAVQASTAGAEVRVRLESSEQVVLHVEDDGIGLDAEAKHRLFDAFYTTRSQGTGLGLAVVKRIADEHAIHIHVHSKEGKGAQFVLDFGESAKAEIRTSSSLQGN